MNFIHQRICSSDKWAARVREVLPERLAGVELGPDVLEIGPGYGATTRVLRFFSVYGLSAGSGTAVGRRNAALSRTNSSPLPAGERVAADASKDDDWTRKRAPQRPFLERMDRMRQLGIFCSSSARS